MTTTAMGPRPINLALQGGGAHGAFTWGVLDYLLEDGRTRIEGVTGASAGALNAVVMADGLARGGPKVAREGLGAFWRAASRDGDLSDAQRRVMDRFFWFAPAAGAPLQNWFETLAQYYSPYDLNPLNINPLRDLIERFVDFDAVRKFDALQLFVSATNVETGRLRVFRRETLSADVVMASSCLPQMFRAVTIDGTAYWDGGYMGNPALFPLFRATDTEDLLIVQINPLRRPGIPDTTKEIVNRLNEITFNASLLGEMRAIDFVTRLVDPGQLPHGSGNNQYRRIKLHRIALDSATAGFTADSKLDTDFGFFLTLHGMGWAAAKAFLDTHSADLGVSSTIDIASEVKAEWA